MIENGRNQRFVFTLYHVESFPETSVGLSIIQVLVYKYVLATFDC